MRFVLSHYEKFNFWAYKASQIRFKTENVEASVTRDFEIMNSQYYDMWNNYNFLLHETYRGAEFQFLREFLGESKTWKSYVACVCFCVWEKYFCQKNNIWTRTASVWKITSIHVDTLTIKTNFWLLYVWFSAFFVLIYYAKVDMLRQFLGIWSAFLSCKKVLYGELQENI